MPRLVIFSVQYCSVTSNLLSCPEELEEEDAGEDKDDEDDPPPEDLVEEDFDGVDLPSEAEDGESLEGTGTDGSLEGTGLEGSMEGMLMAESSL